MQTLLFISIQSFQMISFISSSLPFVSSESYQSFFLSSFRHFSHIHSRPFSICFNLFSFLSLSLSHSQTLISTHLSVAFFWRFISDWGGTGFFSSYRCVVDFLLCIWFVDKKWTIKKDRITCEQKIVFSFSPPVYCCCCVPLTQSTILWINFKFSALLYSVYSSLCSMERFSFSWIFTRYSCFLSMYSNFWPFYRDEIFKIR